MKKALFTLAGAFLVTANVSAQITLNQSSYTSNDLGVDTFLVSAAAATYPNLTPATNAMWDMTTIADTSAFLLQPRVASNVGSAQYAEETGSIFGAFSYALATQNAVQSDAIYQYGETIGRQAYYIGGAIPAGTSTDSIIIDTQNIVYSTPSKTLAFPATYQSSWTNSYNYDFNFEISVAALTYDHAPSQIHAYVTEKDSVTGYGQMKVKDVNGNAFGYVNVLQVQITSNTVDSFFVNGSTAPSFLLTAFGFTQGGTITQTEQKYFQAGNITPLATVDYGGNTSFAQPVGAETFAQRAASEAVVTVNNNTTINVYPNPVTNHTIYVDISGVQNGSYTYDLINVTGQTIATAPISTNHTQVALSSALASGIYYLRVNQAGKSVCIKPLEIN